MSEVAILIPCYNNVKTLSAVVKDFGVHIPSAKIYIYDDGSSDGTNRLVKDLSRVYNIKLERFAHIGIGSVIKTMFDRIDSDVYILVSADGQCSAVEVPSMIRGVEQKDYDMVLGDFLSVKGVSSGRRRSMDNLVRILANNVLHTSFTDVMTPYRAFSRKFVEGVKIDSIGCEVYAELCAKAAKGGYRVSAVPVKCGYDSLSAPGYSVSEVAKIVQTLFRLR